MQQVVDSSLSTSSSQEELDDLTKQYASSFKRYATDPWEFAKDCVYTKDQVDLMSPIKRFPSEMEYLKLYFRVWQRVNLLAIPKSRRMFLSWGTITLYLWDTIFHLGRHNAFVSKKEDDADDLLKRAKFIYDNIPEDKIPKKLLPKCEPKYCDLSFPDIESKIQGFPQGSDQLRAFTFSGIFWDEMAFMEKAELAYAATLPTIEGGGRMTCVSTAAPSFFKKIVFDGID